MLWFFELNPLVLSGVCKLKICWGISFPSLLISGFILVSFWVYICLTLSWLSGDTFTDGSVKYTMTSMNVPEPVMSLAVQPVSKDSGGQVSSVFYVTHQPPVPALRFITWLAFPLNCLQFSKALNRFQKEDPTFRVGLDPESGQVIFNSFIILFQVEITLFSSWY